MVPTSTCSVRAPSSMARGMIWSRERVEWIEAVDGVQRLGNTSLFGEPSGLGAQLLALVW